MKRPYVLLLLAALLALTACNTNEVIDFQKKNYLPVVHGTAGTTQAKAEKTLKKNGFTAAPSTDALRYVKANRDSTIVMEVNYSIVNDTVKNYMLQVSLSNQTDYKQACALYADWSRYAYNTVFSEISLWSGVVSEELADTTMTYMDGGLASMMKTLLQSYYLTGQLDEETYQMLINAFEKKRADFEPILKERDFVADRALYEVYMHATTPIDLTTIMSNIQNIKALTGVLATSETTDETTGKKIWRVAFVFNGEASIMDALGSFM